MAKYKIAYNTELGWSAGTAPTKYYGGDGTYDPASVGIDIFRTPGCLQAGYELTSVGGATVTDNIKHMSTHVEYNGTSTYRMVYMYGDAGRLYSYNGATDAITLIATISNNRLGMAMHKDYLYYAISGYIGRYGILNATTPTVDNTYLGSLTTTVRGTNLDHPLHSWQGRLYIGDGNLLKYVLGSEATTTTGSTALTLDSDMTITAINNTEDLLLMGVGAEVNTAGPGVLTPCFLYTWNLEDPTATGIFEFPEPYIHKIAVSRGQVMVFGTSHVYTFDGANFEIVKSIPTVGQGGVDTHLGQVWWKDNNYISAIGTPNAQLAPAMYAPITGTGTTTNAIKWLHKTKLLVADNNGLYKYDSTKYGASNEFLTRMVSESQNFFVNSFTIYFDSAMASGDACEVRVYNESGTGYLIGSVSHATHGAVNHVELHAVDFGTGAPELTSCQFSVKFTGGSLVVRELIFNTQAVAQP